jgi:hypothetical protein
VNSELSAIVHNRRLINRNDIRILICRYGTFLHAMIFSNLSSMTGLTRFFIRCSGANLSLLEKCPTENVKYAGLGATVFFTGVFAFLSSAYALHTVFDNPWISISLGAVWGLMIFNLDRYIVSGMRKENKPGREFLMALPRIILAVIISVVIAKPLELRIFDKEIQPELAIMEQQAYARQEQEVRKRFTTDDSALRKEIDILSSALEEKTKQRDQLYRIAQEEADGTGGSRKKNLGPIYKLKKRDADAAAEELATLRGRNERLIDSLEQKIFLNDSLMRQSLASLQLSKRNGLAARMEALSRLKEGSDPIRYASIFIMLLFIALECSPVFVKLIAARGPYDNLLKQEEFRFATQETESLAVTSSEARGRTANLLRHENEFVNHRLDDALKKA